MKNKTIKNTLQNLGVGKRFSLSEIRDYCRKYKLLAPPEYLEFKGNECNWLNRNKESFKTLSSFCSAYNGVFISENRNKKHI